MKKYILFLIMSCTSILCFAQKKPRIMVRPSDAWCADNGYMFQNDDMGSIDLQPNYELAFQTDGDLNVVVSKIESMLNDRGYSEKSNMLQEIKNLKQRSARNSILQSKSSGSSISVSPMDELNSQAKADVYFDVYWKVNKIGPRKSVTYILSAYDAYTNNPIANASGTGPTSLTAEVPVLVEEAVLENMDLFLSQLQQYFDDCLENGRPVSIEVNCFDGCNIDMESIYDGKELRELIEDWMSDNTIKRSYNLVDDTETAMYFQDVRIALYDDRERPQAASNFARGLRSYLQTLGITSKINAGALGRAQIVIGEK